MDKKLVAISAFFALFAFDAFATPSQEITITNQSDFANFTYNPSGNWKLNSDKGQSALCADVGSAGSNAVRSAYYNQALDKADCDNVCVSFEIYNDATNNKRDQIQVLGKIDGGEWFNIGDPFNVYDEGTKGVWRITKPVTTYIENLSSTVEDFRVGIHVISAGFSYTSCYIRKIIVEYKASATPTDIKLVKADSVESNADKIPAERVKLVATVQPIPEDDVTLHSVTGILIRNGVTNLVELTKHDASDIWISNDTFVLDAGEDIVLGAESSYESASFGTLGDDGKETVYVNSHVLVPGKGGVWINEFDGNQVEIAGVTNRLLTGGWKLQLCANDTLVQEIQFAEPFTFGNEYNGIGFWVGAGAFTSVANGDYQLKLLNSAGVCECQRTVTYPLSIEYAMKGILPWQGEGWTGEGAESHFAWDGSSKPSMGRVNGDQGVEVPVSGSLGVRVYIEGTDEGVVDAEVNAVAEFSSEFQTKLASTDASGLATVEFAGTHTNTTSVGAVVDATGFGWYSAPTNCELAFGGRTDIDVYMTPSVGVDTFDGGIIKGYWENTANPSKYKWKQPSTDKDAIGMEIANAGARTTASLTTKGSVNSRGKKYSAIDFCVKNVGPNKAKEDHAWCELQADSATIATVVGTTKNPDFTANAFVHYRSFVGVPKDADFVKFALVGESSELAFSGNWLIVDDIRLAFQDSVEVSELAAATNAVTEGQTAAAFSAVVSPLATEAGTKNVSVDFVLKVKDGTKVMKFAVPCDWSNAVAVAGGAAYEGNGPTNTLVEAMRFTATTNDVSAALAAAGGGKYFGTGATIEYYVCAHYYADSNDPAVDEEGKSKEWEERYYPDNHKVDENGVWYVIGDYEPVSTNLTITGPALSFIGDPIPTSDGFSFDFRAFSADGDIVSNGVTAAGVTTSFVADTKTKVMDSSFTWGGEPLDANENYTVTLILWKENGTSVTRDMTITTLGTAAAPTLEGRSANSLTVKADDCKATQIEISCNGEAKWINLGESADFNGLNPDCAYDVTVVAVKNSAGVVTETAAKATFYTLPAQPTDNVEVTPGWDYHVISVANITNDEFGAFGNPSNTAYAFFVENVDNDGKPVATNWLGEADGRIEEVETPTPVWMTLANWDKKTFKLSLTITETNKLYLVAGGREPIPGGHVSANGFEPTLPSPEHIVKISLVVEKDGEAERVAYDPNNHEGTYGFVTFTNKVMTPFENGASSVAVAYEFTTNNGTAWHPMTLESADSTMPGGLSPTISGNEIQGVLSDTCASNIVAVAWNAAANLVFGAVYDVKIRATIKDDYHSSPAPAEISLKSGKMDLQPPVPTISLTKPVLVNGSYARDTELNATVDGAEAYKWKLADGWSDPTAETTISKTGLGQNGHTLAVVGRDEWGNWTLEAEASATNWIVDTVSPTAAIAVPVAGLAKTNNLEFIEGFRLTMDDANFKEPTLSADSFECVNCTIEIDSGSGKSRTFKVTPTADGEVKFRLKAGAFADWANNPNTESGWLSFVSDRTPPKVTVDCAVALTNASPIAFKVTLEDANLEESAAYLTFDKQADQFEVGNGSIDAVSGSGTNYIVKVVPSVENGQVSLKVKGNAFKDVAGNGSIESNVKTVEYDRTAPAVTVDCAVALTNASPIVFTVTVADNHLNEGTSYLTGESQFTIVNGSWDSITGKGASYVVKIAPNADGKVTLKVNAGAFKDEAGNDNTASEPAEVVSDRTAPTATVVRTTALTNGVPIAFKVTLADSQTNLVMTGRQYLKDASQFTFGTGCELDHIEGTAGTNYVVWVKRTGDGDVTLQVKEGAFKDEAGNDNTASDVQTTAYDQTAPAVTVSCAVALTNASPIVFTVTVADNHLNEGTSYLTGESQFTIVNGSWDSISGKGASYLVKIAPNADGKVTLKVNAGAFKDEAGNDNTASEPAEVVSDRTAPTATVVRTTALTNGVPVAFKVMLADSQTNLVMIGRQYLKDASQFTFGTGCELDHIEGTAGTNYVVWVKRTGDGDVTLQVNAGAFKDEAGNDSIASDSATTVYDHTPPTVTIRPDGVGDRTFVKEIPFKVIVRDEHEVITALTAASFTITATNEANDEIANPAIVSGSFTNDGNTNYTFRVSSPEKALEGPVWISVGINTPVKDVVGNETTQAEGGVISDRTQPGVTIWTDAPSTNNAAVVDYKLSIASFSPITNNLAATNITVPSGCNVTFFEGIGETIVGDIYTNYSFKVETQASVDTLMAVSLPAGSVFNSAGNSNDVAVANTVVSDHTPPVPVLACVAASPTNNLEKIPYTIKVVETNGLGGVLSGDSVKVESGDVRIEGFAGSGSEYSFNVVPNGNDVGEIKVKVNAAAITDFAGNASVESEVVSVVSDRTEPTATMATATDLSIPRKEDVLAFTITLADSQNHLSAESNYLSSASFETANCEVTAVEGRGLSYTVSVAPSADGEVSVGVMGGAFKDTAGNTNKASNVMSFISDRTKPVVKVEGALSGTTKLRHFEMKVSAKDTPETTNVVWYSWSVKGSGQSFGDDFVEIGTNDTDVATLRGTGLNDGVWNWKVEFKDIAGNVTTSNGSWAVKTDEAPELELTPTSGTVNGSATEPLVFTLKANGDLKLTEALKPDMVHHVSRDQVFYRQVVAIASDSEATITLTPVKQDRDFTDEVTLTIPCGAATGTNGIAAATLSGTVTYKFSGTNKNPETVRIVRTAVGYLDDPHRTNENLGEITLFAKTFNGAKFAQGLTKESVIGASVKSVAVAADGLSAEITLTADAQKQLVDIDGWKGFNLVFAGGSVESLPSPIAAGTPVTVSVKVWRNLARVAGANGAAIKVDEADAPLAHDGDARTAQVEGSTKLAATFPRARVNSVHIRLSAASAKAAYKPTQATVTLKSAGKTVETFVTDLVWDGKRCAPVDLLVTPQDMLVGEAIADEATLSFTGSTAALYLDEFAVFGIPEAVDPLYPEILSVNPVEGGFVVQTDMGVSNWVKSASDTALKLESDGVTTGVAIDWAQIDWADTTRTALRVPISGSADAGYVGGATLHVYEGFLGNFIGRSNICETISTTNLTWNSQTAPEALSFTRYGGTGESVAFGADSLSWELILNQPVLNLSGEKSFNKHAALGTVQVLGTGSPTNYIVRAQLNCWTNEVSDVKVTLKPGAVKGLTGKSNEADKASDAYKLEEVVPVSK